MLFIILVYLLLIIIIIFLSAYLIFNIYYSIKTKIPFVGSNKKTVEKFFELYNFKKNETFIDLGCGSGKIVFLAAKKGLNCFGYEINPLLVWWANFFKKIKRIKNANFFNKNLKEADIKNADYIYLYLTPKFLASIEKWLFAQIKKDAKVITFQFKFPNKKPKEIFLENFYIYQKQNRPVYSGP